MVGDKVCMGDGFNVGIIMTINLREVIWESMRKEKRKLSEAWMLVFCTLCVISASIATLFYFPLALLGCTCRSETISTGASPPAVYVSLDTEVLRYKLLSVIVLYHIEYLIYQVPSIPITWRKLDGMSVPWWHYVHWITARISNTRPAIPTTAARSR